MIANAGRIAPTHHQQPQYQQQQQQQQQQQHLLRQTTPPLMQPPPSSQPPTSQSMAGLNHMSASPLGPPPLGHHLGQSPFGPGGPPPHNGAPGGHPPYPLLPGGPFCPPLGPPPPLPPGFPLGLPPGPHVQPRRKNATRETTQLLKTWLNAHKTNPYPTKQEKIFLAVWASMTMTQVSTWFANARRRLKKENKMTWSPRNRCDDDDDDDDNDDDDDDHDDDMSSNGHGGGRGNSAGPNHDDMNDFSSPHLNQQQHSDHHLNNTNHLLQQQQQQPQHNQTLHGPYNGLNGTNEQVTRQAQQQLFEQRHLSELVRLSQQAAAANGAHQLAKQQQHDPQHIHQSQQQPPQHQHAVLAAAMAAAQQHHQQSQNQHLNDHLHQSIRTSPPNTNSRLPQTIDQPPAQQQQPLPSQLSNMKQQEQQLQQQIQQHLQQQLQQQFKQQQPNANHSNANNPQLPQLSAEQFSSSAAAAHLFQSSLHPSHPLYHMMAAHHAAAMQAAAAAAAAVHAQAQHQHQQHQQQQHQRGDQRHVENNIELNRHSQNRILSSKEDEEVDVVERDEHDIVGERVGSHNGDENDDVRNNADGADEQGEVERRSSSAEQLASLDDLDVDESRMSHRNKRKRSAVKLEAVKPEPGIDLSDDSDATDPGELSDNNVHGQDEDEPSSRHKSKKIRKSSAKQQNDAKRISGQSSTKQKRPHQDKSSKASNNNNITHNLQASIPKTSNKAVDQSNDPFIWRPFA